MRRHARPLYVAVACVSLCFTFGMMLWLSCNRPCVVDGGAGGISKGLPHGDRQSAMPVVEYYVHGHGNGHATRAKTVANSLQGSGEYAMCVLVDPRVARALEGTLGEVVLVNSLPSSATPWGILRTLVVIVQRFLMDCSCDVCQRHARPSPIAVITDGDLPGVLRANRASIPSIALGHGYLFSSTERPVYIPQHAWDKQARLNRRITSRSTYVVGASFAHLTPLSDNVIVAKPRLRPAVEQAVRPVTAITSNTVAVYLRDKGTGVALIHALVDLGFRVLAFGNAPTDVEGVEATAYSEQGFVDAITNAAAVVGSSGDNLIAEVLHLGVPMLALYTVGDTEQEINAKMYEHTGKGMAVSFEEATFDVVKSFTSQLQVYEQVNYVFDAPDVVEATEILLKRMQKQPPPR
eukprot:m.148216 g.148216  ORF g.148216 m.148216 type:complete len:407 (-) comp14170_c0_seq1:84-1304(-)